MKKTFYVIIVTLFLTMVAIIPGCSSSNENETETTNDENPAETTTNHDGEASFPVTIRNADRDLTFEEPPERVVALYQQEAELMAALGLEDKLVGYSIVSDNMPEEYEESLADVPVLAENDYPSKEVLLENDPDFAIGSERTFQDSGVGTVEELEKLGIDAYVTESEKPETIDNMVFKEIEDIAAIFGVEERGEELIQSMQADIDAITDQVGDVEDPLKVFYMSSGEAGSAMTAGGTSLDNHLIELAGGENIFGDVDEYLFEVTWEEVIDRNPDVIITSYCCGTSPEDLQDMINNNSSLEEVTAVEENNFVAAQVEDLTGNVRTTRGLEILAKGFYPEKFE